ncbi:MAG: adenylate/guanylate cyclase domain-containing protein, partial [Limnothrix sp. RL_2_0]|nr:adenylate/guanylate cyclase domain-containing protein [Limnothrix sp. RL_2_0]
GMIQVTSDFKDQLGDRYIFEQREQIEVKGKGLMQTYFLVSKKSGVSRSCG